jgi:hypothetical protein
LATICPVLGGYSSVDVLIEPKPDTICSPGEQAPLLPEAVLQVGAVWGLMPVPLTVGLLKYVRLKIFVNSARTFRVTFSLILNCRPTPKFSVGRRCPR